MDPGVSWPVVLLALIIAPLSFIWLRVLNDVFGRLDLGPYTKVAWLLVVAFVPLLGALVYLCVRPKQNVDSVPGLGRAQAGFIAERLTQLTRLCEQDVITPEEFERQRARLLAE